MTGPVAFRRAESVEEACALLAEHEDARIVSGGTALAILMRQGLVRPELLIGVRHIPRLREIEPDGVLRLGAGVPLRAVEHHPAIQERWPLVAETLRKVATPRPQYGHHRWRPGPRRPGAGPPSDVRGAGRAGAGGQHIE